MTNLEPSLTQENIFHGALRPSGFDRRSHKNKSIKKLEDIFGRELKKIKEEFSFCQKIDFSLKTGVIKKNITEVELKFLENEISIYENNFKVNLEMRECDE